MKFDFLIMLFVVTSTAYGQKIKPVFNDETNEISIDGNYYIMMEKMSGGNMGMAKNFSIQNKDGDELLFMKFTPRTNSNNETSYWYRMTFNESESWFWLSNSIAGMSTKGAMKFLIKNELILDGNLDKKKAKQIVQRHNGKLGYFKSDGPSQSTVKLVDNEIFQDDVLIGKVLERHSEEDRVYHVYDTSGSKIIVASISKSDPLEWVLTSNKGDTYNVLYEGEQDGVKILTYVASKGWLK